MLPIERRSNISEQENLKALREFRNKTSTKIYRALYDIESKLTEKRWIPILPGACKFLIATIQTTCATILGALAFVPGFFSENARSFGKHCFTHITHGLTNMCIGSAEVVAGPLLYVQEKALLSDLQDKSHEKLETGFKSVLLPQYSDLIIADAHFVAGPEKTQEGAIEFQDQALQNEIASMLKQGEKPTVSKIYKIAKGIMQENTPLKDFNKKN